MPNNNCQDCYNRYLENVYNEKGYKQGRRWMCSIDEYPIDFKNHKPCPAFSPRTGIKERLGKGGGE